jgi:hypothetical protein
MEDTTAYQMHIYAKSEGNQDMIQHIITTDLIQGNTQAFDLCEEAKESFITRLSVYRVSEYLINKIKNHGN